MKTQPRYMCGALPLHPSNPTCTVQTGNVIEFVEYFACIFDNHKQILLYFGGSKIRIENRFVKHQDQTKNEFIRTNSI